MSFSAPFNDVIVTFRLISLPSISQQASNLPSAAHFTQSSVKALLTELAITPSSYSNGFNAEANAGSLY